MSFVCCLHSVEHVRPVLSLYFDSKDLVLLDTKLDLKNCFLEFYSKGDFREPMTRYKIGRKLLRLHAKSKKNAFSHFRKTNFIGCAVLLVDSQSVIAQGLVGHSQSLFT